MLNVFSKTKLQQNHGSIVSLIISQYLTVYFLGGYMQHQIDDKKTRY